MKNHIQRLLHFNKFFAVQSINDLCAIYKLKKPSKILMQNVYSNWLYSIYTKTRKQFPVLINKNVVPESKPIGYITHHKIELDQEFDHNIENIAPSQQTELKCDFIVEMQDIMPYFIQWQRYRKYWWSSITTTPSLFSIDSNQENEDSNNVSIVANFPWGKEIVENVSIKSPYKNKENEFLLSCNTTLECAFFVLLLDGSTNASKEVLKLHRRMAPFKICFALNSKDESKKKDLEELAVLIHHSLENGKISALLPDFTIPIEEQLKENLRIGIVYTAILSDSTLSDGIFHLMSSSTMLMEQVHVADFHSYASLIFRKLL